MIPGIALALTFGHVAVWAADQPPAVPAGDDRPTAGEAIEPPTRGQERQVYVFGGPDWIDAWIRNTGTARGEPFGTLVNMAVITSGSPETPDRVIETCRKLDQLHWPYAVGIKAFGWKTYQDWLDVSFWRTVTARAEKLIPLVGHRRLLFVDFEPYQLKGKRYPHLSDAYELALGMEPFISMLKEHNLGVCVLQGDLRHLYLWLLRANGITVILFDKAVDRAPYDLPQWLNTHDRRRQAAHAAGMGFVPVFYAASLLPDFQKKLQEKQIRRYGVFFAGKGLEGVPQSDTRENVWQWGRTGWSPIR